MSWLAAAAELISVFNVNFPLERTNYLVTRPAADHGRPLIHYLSFIVAELGKRYKERASERKREEVEVRGAESKMK